MNETVIIPTGNAELVPVTKEQNILTLKEVADDLTITITEDANKQLAELQSKYAPENIPTDLSVKENYELVHKAVQQIKAPRILLEKNRKEVVAPLNTATNAVNSAAKPIKEAYETLEEPWKKAKKDFDTQAEIDKREAAQAEEKRVDLIAGRIADTKALPGAHIKSDSAAIGVAIAKLELDHESFNYMEFSEKGESAQTEALDMLNELYSQKDKQEQLDLKLAKEKEDREAEEAKRKAEEDARIEQQRIDQEATQKKLDAQQAEIDRQKKELEDAEQKRIDAIQAETDAKAETERLAAEKKLADEKAAADKKIADEKAKKDAEDEQKRVAAAEKRKSEIMRIVAGDMFNLGLFSDIEQAHGVVVAIETGNIKYLQFVL